MEKKMGETTEKKQEEGYFCEVCKTKYGHQQAKILKWACCGHEMSRLEVLYRSEPSPTGA